MPFVYSTLTNDYAYTNWEPHLVKGQPHQVITHDDNFKEQIVIKGGANLSDQRFITPFGVRTEVDDRQHDCLMRNNTFKKHVKQGFIIVLTSKEDADLVAKEHLEARDASAPYTPKSDIFRDKGEDTITPKVSAVDKIKGMFS